MVSPSTIMERIRSRGANVVIDGGRLQIVNGKKLPQGAADYIRSNAKAIADFLCQEGEFEERAAIIEFEAGAPREVAERFAKLCMDNLPRGWSEFDRSWLIGRCAKIIDEIADFEPQARAA